MIKGTTTERADQLGLISEVRRTEGSPPYVVRWLATGHEETVYPSSDAIIVTAAEQEPGNRITAPPSRSEALLSSVG